MIILGLGSTSKAYDKPAHAPFNFGIQYDFPIYSYPDPQIWGPASVYLSEIKSPEQKTSSQTNSEKFHDALIEIAFNLRNIGTFDNPIPQQYLSNSPFFLSSFMWPSLPLQNQDCQKLEAIPFLQKFEGLAATPTLFTIEPVEHLQRCGN
ncbi:hypothetical protein ID47_06775 [Candidatus Paracaedibacter acanthamoebae]|uniref:Uncharacterized protein n=2 Tax=Candidatus Odyssella acanthamoebae TaxID=91604 RepID=A0A077B0R3_9PROT|nr:hypothetical protein ID47_06775 [Candidatus Paracaedibacter acanthamoebae]